jgi:GNAT superfamily N-acetyltransferase
MTKSKTTASGGRKKSDSITFRVDFEVSLSQYEGDPSDYIAVYQGEVIGMMDDDSERKIGNVVIYLVERGRVLNEGISLFEVMDCLDGDSCDCFANLFDQESEQLKPEVERLLSENRAFQNDIMLIERLELKPEYRGQGLGKEIASRVIQKFGQNSSVIACVPVPLQFTGLGPGDKEPKGNRLAQQRVRKFWDGVGFVRVPRSDYYIWPD